jgi:hypothetical protein
MRENPGITCRGFHYSVSYILLFLVTWSISPSTYISIGQAERGLNSLTTDGRTKHLKGEGMTRNLNIHAAVLLLILFSSTRILTQPKIYTDNNQYFAAIPPQGWQKEENPSETIRSKVVFRHPSLNLLIRVTAEPAVRKDFTFDDLYAQHQIRQGQMRDRFPRGKYEMQSGSLGELKAVIHRNSYSNGEEHDMLTVVDNGIIYTIGLNAESLEELNSGRRAFEAFKNSFVTLSKRKTFTGPEIKASLVAKNLRLAELSNQQGKNDEAIQFIKQGLALEPSNVDLKALLAEIQPQTQMTGGRTYYNAKYKFSMVLPTGWVEKSSNSPGMVVKVVHRTESEFAMLNITVEEVTSGSITARSYLAQLEGARRDNKMSYDDAGIERINGEDAVWIRQTMERISMTSLSYNFIRGNKLFTVHASSDPSQFDKFEGIFKTSIATFRFD